MAEPRYLFVAGVAPVGEAVLHWPGAAGTPTASLNAGALSPDRSWVAWRLAGANNRELGRSASIFADIGVGKQAVARLRRDVGAAEAVPILDESTGLWGWRLDLAGETVAVAARRYRRQRECHYNLAQFVAAVPVARLAPHVVSLARATGREPPGRRREHDPSSADRERPSRDRETPFRTGPAPVGDRSAALRGRAIPIHDRCPVTEAS